MQILRHICEPCIQKYDQYIKNTYFSDWTCPLTDKEIQDYQSFTFLSSAQIRKLYKMFHSLNQEESDRTGYVEHLKVLQLPRFALNPLIDKILETFSMEKGVMTFDEFVDMMSVLSEQAPFKVKVEYAFRIFDFGSDNMIDEDDLRELLSRLQGDNRLTAIETDMIINNVMAEGDLDADGFMTFIEFKQLIKKCPDFVDSFSVRI